MSHARPRVSLRGKTVVTDHLVLTCPTCKSQRDLTVLFLGRINRESGQLEVMCKACQAWMPVRPHSLAPLVQSMGIRSGMQSGRGGGCDGRKIRA